MVDVSAKANTERVAVAQASVFMKPETLQRIHEGKIAKGDVLAVAQVAGVMGAKRTPDLIPMCHPLIVSSVDIDFLENPKPDSAGQCSLRIQAAVKTSGQTGVEMEAIMGVNAALITIYDLSKIVNPHLKIDNVKLLIKEGGKSGFWTNPDGLPKFLENIF